MNTAKTVFLSFGGAAIVVLSVAVAALNISPSDADLSQNPAVLGMSTHKQTQITAEATMFEVVDSDGSGFSVSGTSLEALASSLPETATAAGYYDSMVKLSDFLEQYSLTESIIRLESANGTEYILLDEALTGTEYVLLSNAEVVSLSVIQDQDLSDVALIEDISRINIDRIK